MMSRFIFLSLMFLSSGVILAQSNSVTRADYFQSLLVESRQKSPSFQEISAQLQVYKQQRANQSMKDTQSSKRLALIAQKEAMLRAYFDYFSKPVPMRNSQRLHFGNDLVPRDFTPVNLPEFPLEMLETTFQVAVQNYSQAYQDFIDLKNHIEQRAGEQLKTRNSSFEELEASYSQAIKTIFQKHQANHVDRRDLILVMRAAQMPTIGFRSPPGPTISPEFIYLFEALALAQANIAYKIELAACVTAMNSSEASACMGLLFQQALYAQAKGFEDPAFRTYMFQILDYFRNHPSHPTAIALSETLAHSVEMPEATSRFLSARLASDAWQRFLNRQEQDGTSSEHTRRLQLIAQKARYR